MYVRRAPLAIDLLSCFAGLLLTSTSFAASATQDVLANGFEQPPAAAKPRVWWHWMNGNITKEGIKRDLEWMQRIGIGGVQTFDAALNTPQVTDRRLAFMTPEWKDAFSYATRLADQLGLEFAIAGSPGWSETGGPWVKPNQAMKKLVWSTTRTEGGERFNAVLPKPPSVSGPYQNRARSETFALASETAQATEFYADAAVIAYRAPAGDVPLVRLKPIVSSSGGPLNSTLLDDGDVQRTQSIPMAADRSAWIQYGFDRPQTIYGVSLGLEHTGLPLLAGGVPELAELQVSDDGAVFHSVGKLFTASGGLQQAPGLNTIAIAPITTRYVRLLLNTPPPAGASGFDLSFLGVPANLPPATDYRVSEFAVKTAPVVNLAEDKAGFGIGSNLSAAATSPIDTASVIAKSEVVDLTNRMRRDGSLGWTPPPGEWVILRMGYSLTGAKNSPASPEATGLEVDKLNARYVREYLNNYLDQYQRATQGLMGKHGVQYLVTDSWEAGAQNWTDDMLDEFKRRRGYDMRPWLPVLTGRVVQSAADSDRFLWDFRCTLGELIIDNHYAQLAVQLRKRGMGLYSESHESGRAFIGDGMQVKRGASVPMGAMWAQVPNMDSEQYGYNADIRESASVAHLYGQNLVAAESFTAGFGAWAWSPEDLKATADKELAMGLNRFVIHTSVHQPLLDKAPGLALGPFGQWFTRNETWAEQATPWIQYLARSSYLLQQGRFVADIAYYYGEDSNVTALFGSKSPDVPSGYNYDFINADALRNLLSVSNGELLAPSGMRYRVLALDENARYMSLPVLRKLAQLIKNGAIVVGARPFGTPSLADDQQAHAQLVQQLWGDGAGEHRFGKGRVYSGQSLPAVLQQLNIVADFDYDKPQNDAELLFVHRRLNEGELYFVSNRNARPQTVNASFRVTGKRPELWHADTGLREAVSYRMSDGRTAVTLDLRGNDAVFVVFREATQQREWLVPPRHESVLTELDGNWLLSFQPERGAPAQTQLTKLASWSESNEAGIKYFSGTGIYSRTLSIDATWLGGNQQLWLDLGSVKNLAEVIVNGQSIGTVWKPPFRVDVTRALKPGINELQIKVTNLWVNRLIGDQQPGAPQKISFTTQAFYKADAPLLPSGLLGPVQLIAVENKL